MYQVGIRVLTINIKERYRRFMAFNQKIEKILSGKITQGTLFVGASREDWFLICKQIQESLEVSQFDTISIAEPPKVEELRVKLAKAHYYPINSNKSLLFLLDVDLWSADTLNTMLKLIEEPPEFLKIFLFAKKTSGILPTILSRIQLFSLEASAPSKSMLGLTELKKMPLVESLEEIKNLTSEYKAPEILNHWLSESSSGEAQIIVDSLQLAGNQPINQRLLVESLFFKIKFNQKNQ